MITPVTGGIEPGKRARKGWILPAPCQPGTEVHQSQGPKSLDPAQLSVLKIMKLAVAVEHFSQLNLLPLAFAAQEHPDILHGRRHARIVEIDEIWQVIPPQDIARMAVAMNADVILCRQA